MVVMVSDVETEQLLNRMETPLDSLGVWSERPY